MIKNILGWALYGGLVLVLVMGAVNRTAARTEQGGRAGQGDAGVPLPADLVEHREEGRERLRGNSAFHFQRESAGGEEREGPGPVHEDRAANTRSGTGDREWQTLTGKVAVVDELNMRVELDQAGSLVLERRAWRYAQEIGFWPAPGNEVVIEGFYEGEKFEVGMITDLTLGERYQLREQSGRPLWAGGGGH